MSGYGYYQVWYRVDGKPDQTWVIAHSKREAIARAKAKVHEHATDFHSNSPVSL